jgi:hypothetical protein
VDAMMNDIVALMVWKQDDCIATPIYNELTDEQIEYALTRIYHHLRHYSVGQDVTIDDVLVYKIGDMLRPVTKTVWE